MFQDIIDIDFPLFHLSMQDFIEVRGPKSSASLYELLLKFESQRSEMNHLRQRTFHDNQFTNEGEIKIFEMVTEIMHIMIMELAGICQMMILVIDIAVTLKIVILIELEYLVMLIEIVVQISEVVLVIEVMV